MGSGSMGKIPKADTPEESFGSIALKSHPISHRILCRRDIGSNLSPCFPIVTAVAEFYAASPVWAGYDTIIHEENGHEHEGAGGDFQKGRRTHGA